MIIWREYIQNFFAYIGYPPHFDFRHYKQSSGTFYLLKYYNENTFF